MYNKVNQLYVYIYPHISSLLRLPPFHPPYPTPLGGHKAPSFSPCAMWLLPTSYLFYIWKCIYVHATLSLRPSLPFPLPMSSSPFSTSVSLFLSCPHYSAIKRNETELFVVRWMDLESVIQSEVSRKEKNKRRMLTYIYGDLDF